MSDSVPVASCHCGAVVLHVNVLPERYTVCNCSICRRYAARWLYYRCEEVRIAAAADAIDAYIWGDRMIKFCRCRNCGCLTHYEDVEQTPQGRVALNGNMLPPGTIEHLQIRYFDGADTFKSVE